MAENPPEALRRVSNADQVRNARRGGQSPEARRARTCAGLDGLEHGAIGVCGLP